MTNADITYGIKFENHDEDTLKAVIVFNHVMQEKQELFDEDDEDDEEWRMEEDEDSIEQVKSTDEYIYGEEIYGKRFDEWIYYASKQTIVDCSNVKFKTCLRCIDDGFVNKWLCSYDGENVLLGENWINEEGESYYCARVIPKEKFIKSVEKGDYYKYIKNATTQPRPETSIGDDWDDFYEKADIEYWDMDMSTYDISDVTDTMQTKSIDNAAVVSLIQENRLLKFGRRAIHPDEEDSPTKSIVWRVIHQSDCQILIMANDRLPLGPYHKTSADNEYAKTTWEHCIMRKTLNDKFFNESFSEEEKGIISEVCLSNPNNPEYGTEGGNDTMDRIFLLSIDEYDRYLPGKNRSKKLFLENGPDVNRLRTPGSEPGATITTGENGLIYLSGEINEIAINTKPCMWLDLEKVNEYTGLELIMDEK